MLLHEVIQVILIFIDALQKICPLKLQPVQLFIHLAEGRSADGVRSERGSGRKGPDGDQGPLDVGV